MELLPHARFATSTGRPRRTSAPGTRCPAGPASRRARSRSARRSRRRSLRGRTRTAPSCPWARSASSACADRRSCRATGATRSGPRVAPSRLAGRHRGYPVYRTGDLAQLDENGDWIFLGPPRLPDQEPRLPDRARRHRGGAPPPPGGGGVRGRRDARRAGHQPDQGVRRRSRRCRRGRAVAVLLGAAPALHGSRALQLRDELPDRPRARSIGELSRGRQPRTPPASGDPSADSMHAS